MELSVKKAVSLLSQMFLIQFDKDEHEALAMAIDALNENTSLRARLDKAVELPCKVGDTVYMVFDGLIKVLIVESIHCWKSGKWRISAHTDKTNKYWAGYEIDPKGFGIKFFLAEAEAQAKLEEMKGGAE
ncbi:hypothetical protein [Anaerotignum sp. MB30-C6]|uniref:hypothetical protein n=1 Tax=Anaerotignum sp. MB30-C6 TaxID=3070814 RepID=UPI0027DB0BBF|nr:hypothetical protein [Anaerotignum sp. MB30-C6]WMI80921.1 hypothetical protein RBQ60_14040 [Anaerotignum sp. MB30-C6]